MAIPLILPNRQEKFQKIRNWQIVTPALAGCPVRRGFSIPSQLLWNTGSSAFADDDSWECGRRV
jgi:hypothetical protein